MDQGRLAGVGNLLADEMLWTGLAPDRRTPLDDDELRALHRAVRRRTLRQLGGKGDPRRAS